MKLPNINHLENLSLGQLTAPPKVIRELKPLAEGGGPSFNLHLQCERGTFTRSLKSANIWEAISEAAAFLHCDGREMNLRFNALQEMSIAELMPPQSE